MAKETEGASGQRITEIPPAGAIISHEMRERAIFARRSKAVRERTKSALSSAPIHLSLSLSLSLSR